MPVLHRTEGPGHHVLLRQLQVRHADLQRGPPQVVFIRVLASQREGVAGERHLQLQLAINVEDAYFGERERHWASGGGRVVR